jgi:hypothetical protein
MSIDNPDFRVQLDACRPDSDDLQQEELCGLAEQVDSDPALRVVLERSFRWDQAIGKGVKQVAVPTNLSARLLTAVSRAETSPVADEVLSVGPPAAMCPPSVPPAAARAIPTVTPLPPPVVVRPRPFYRGRRMAVLGIGMVLTAAAALVILAVLPHSAESITPSTLDPQVCRWVESVQAGQWHDKDLPVKDFPLSSSLQFTARKWQRLPKSLSTDPVVCYDLTPRGARAVLLFVMRTSRNISLPSRPGRPTLDTQMLSVGAWSDANSKGIVYALAVEGNAERFQGLIRPKIAVNRMVQSDRVHAG